MITKRTLALGFVAIVLFAGCKTTPPVAIPTIVVKADPAVMKASTEYFDVEVIPGLEPWCCTAFTLIIKNKTDRNLEVDWNKTLYVTRGQTSGGFMFEGVVYKDRNNPKSPDIVFAKGTFEKTIWPNSLVEYVGGKYTPWKNGMMPPGEHGIYLTVNIDGKEVTQKLVTNITFTEVLH